MLLLGLSIYFAIGVLLAGISVRRGDVPGIFGLMLVFAWGGALILGAFFGLGWLFERLVGQPREI